MPRTRRIQVCSVVIIVGVIAAVLSFPNWGRSDAQTSKPRLQPSSAQKSFTRPEVCEVDPYVARKLFYEEYWQHKIESGLKYIPGAIVRVNVELEPEIEKSTTTIEYNPQKSASVEQISRTETSAEKESVNVSDGVSCTVNIAGQACSPVVVSETNEERSTTVAGRTEVETAVAGLTPHTVTVAVVVPRSHYKRVWHSQNRTNAKTDEPSADELSRISDLVNLEIKRLASHLIPRLPSSTKYESTVVVSFDDLAT